MRPQKYSEETKIVSVRIPLSKIKEFKVVTDAFLGKCGDSGELTNTAKTQKPKPEFINSSVKPKWMIDAEERMKRNKL